MNAIKERLIGAITVMSDSDALELWGTVQDNYSNRTWNDIPMVEPDELDLQMLEDIENDPDCQTLASPEEVGAVLNGIH